MIGELTMASVCLFLAVLRAAIAEQIRSIELKDLPAALRADKTVVVFALGSTNRKSRDLRASLELSQQSLKAEFPQVDFFRFESSGPGADADYFFDHFNVLDFPAALISRSGVWQRFPPSAAQNLSRMRVVLRKKASRAVVNATTLGEVEDFGTQQLTIVYFAASIGDEKKLRGLLQKHHRHRFVRVQDEDLMKNLTLKYGRELKNTANSSAVLVIRTIDNSSHLLTGAIRRKSHKLDKLIRQAAKCSWVGFNKKSAEILGNTDKFVLLLAHDGNLSRNVSRNLKDIAVRYSRDLIVFFVPPKDPVYRQFIIQQGLFKIQNASFLLLQRDFGGYFKKYIAENINMDSKLQIERFIQKCIDGAQKRYFMSQPVPPEVCKRDGPNILVGTTIGPQVFAESFLLHIVMFATRDTAHDVYIFSQFATKLKHPKLRFHVFDTEKNEHPDVLPSYPGSVVVISNQVEYTIEECMHIEEGFQPSKFLAFLKKSLGGDSMVSGYINQVVVANEEDSCRAS